MAQRDHFERQVGPASGSPRLTEVASAGDMAMRAAYRPGFEIINQSAWTKF
ncbi:MAG: hypothetical protein ACLQDV_11035 [Candidatus Binataceae bacterium]